jgi:hypothetical protein
MTIQTSGDPMMTIRRLFWLLIAYTLIGAATEVGKLLIAAEEIQHILTYMHLGKTSVPAAPSIPTVGAAPPTSQPTEPAKPTVITPELPKPAVTALEHARPTCKITPDTAWTYSMDEAATIWKCMRRQYFAFQCTSNGIIFITERNNRFDGVRYFRSDYIYA